MIEAVCLVDPKTLRICAANQVFASLVGLPTAEFLNKPVVEMTSSPEDLFFWEDVAAGLADNILSQSLVRCADGIAIPVERKVSRVWLNPQEPVYLVGLRDLRQQDIRARYGGKGPVSDDVIGNELRFKPRLVRQELWTMRVEPEAGKWRVPTQDEYERQRYLVITVDSIHRFLARQDAGLQQHSVR